jgi:hypothetical protein
MCHLCELNINVLPATNRGVRAGKHVQRGVSAVVSQRLSLSHHIPTSVHGVNHHNLINIQASTSSDNMSAPDSDFLSQNVDSCFKEGGQKNFIDAIITSHSEQ